MKASVSEVAAMIATKHLADRSNKLRQALARDIREAIIQHAGLIASAVIDEAIASKATEQKP